MRIRTAALLSSFTISSASVAQTPPAQLRLTQEARIDGGTESLNGFGTVLVGSDGRVVIPQAREGQFLFYDSRGNKLGAFGRVGRGPGEFDGSGVPLLLGWRGDTLWIHDFNQRRITFVSPDLKLVRTEAWREAPNVPRPPATRESGPPPILRPAALYPDNSQLAQYSFGAPDPTTGLISDNRYIIVGPKGDIVREVLRVPPTTTRVGIKGPWGVAMADVPFASQPFARVSPTGSHVAVVSAATASGTQGSYTITLIRMTGDTAFSKAFPYTAVLIPAKAKADELEARLQRGRRRPTEGPDAGAWPTEELVEKVRPLIPAFYAPVRDVRVGNDDSIWLWMHDDDPTPRYRVVDSRGTLRGEVLLPPRSSVVAASTSQLWLIERDQDDVPSLVRYRISR
jgi:hypothetical protein